MEHVQPHRALKDSGEVVLVLCYPDGLLDRLKSGIKLTKPIANSNQAQGCSVHLVDRHYGQPLAQLFLGVDLAEVVVVELVHHEDGIDII